jgi:hypothetical protein
VGEPLDGTWELMTRDQGSNGTGMLNSWGVHDITGFECDIAVVSAPDAAVPLAFALGRNTPNPFNPATEISFAVPTDAGTVRLEVFDDQALPSGRHTSVWNGRTDKGRQVASGVYFYRLTGRGFSETRKMVAVQ